MLLACAAPLGAQTSDAQSRARIRAALEKVSPRLQLPAPSTDTPTFRVEVRERSYMLPPIEEQPPDPTYGLPSVGELLTGGIGKLHAAVVNYRHKRVERRAQREVDGALAAFCAAQQCPSSTAGK